MLVVFMLDFFYAPLTPRATVRRRRLSYGTVAAVHLFASEPLRKISLWVRYFFDAST
jgi:hypothetical protein